MELPDSSRFDLTGDLRICRVLNGMWQVSGAHGRIDPGAAVQAMFLYQDSGFTTWDLADHYGPAEDFIGEFRRRLLAERGEEGFPSFQAFTKWVPSPGRMTRQIVESNLDISLRRMDVQNIDLMQFHWWDYRDEAYLDALTHLSDLRDAGKLRHVGLTNFDTQRLSRIAEHGVRIVSNQVQYSIIDRRPEVRMVEFCRENNVHLLAYGTLCGGLLSERFLGQPEPGPRELTTVSLKKYKQMVDAWGGWELFQKLLGVLKTIGDRRQVSVANLAVRYVLDRPAVAGAIVGVRLGVSDNREANAKVFDFNLEPEDMSQIDGVLAKSRNLYDIIGDCGDEYRR